MVDSPSQMISMISAASLNVLCNQPFGRQLSRSSTGFDYHLGHPVLNV